jgi:hypothetical protein
LGHLGKGGINGRPLLRCQLTTECRGDQLMTATRLARLYGLVHCGQELCWTSIIFVKRDMPNCLLLTADCRHFTRIMDNNSFEGVSLD